MRFVSLAFAALGVVSCVTAANTADRFQTYHAQSKSAPIDLDDSIYSDITSQPHDYYVAVLLTAMEARYGCQLCREFQPEWELVARSWNKGPARDSRILFGTLDFGRGKSTFQKVKSSFLKRRSKVLTQRS